MEHFIIGIFISDADIQKCLCRSGRAAASGPALVQRAVDLNYWSRKRASSLRWSALNAAALLMLAYDLSCKCPGYTSLMHYVEMCMAAVACANLLQYALQLLPRACSGTPLLAVTPAQRRLLGLADSDLDSSFRMVERSASATSRSSCSSAPAALESDSSLSLSLSPRAWRASPTPAPLSQSGSPGGSPAGAADLLARSRVPHDEFISDSTSLGDYLRQYEERRAREGAAPASCGPAWGAPPPPLYQLASIDFESKLEERGAGGGCASAGGAVAVAELCHLDPQRLTQYNFNLRLWIQLTILERLVAELAQSEAALARMGLAARLGELSLERLRKLASAPSGLSGPLPALLPFLEPFADQAYAVRRIRDLAAGGCLSGYKWDGGGVDWGPGKPTDAELLLHLFATYLDAQLPPAAAGAAAKRPFSSEFLSAAPAPLGPGPAVHLASRPPAPPHYVMALRGAALDVGPGRNNLLHVLLLLLAELARREPPALRRLHLGPAGLNMLWIIGR